LKIYLTVITGRLPENSGKKACYFMEKGKECRIPAEDAERFLPLMELIDEQPVSHPFIAMNRFYGPKKGREKEVLKITHELVEKKNNNKIKWRIAVHFPHLRKKFKLTWR
jgi:hypothetical protein